MPEVNLRMAEGQRVVGHGLYHRKRFDTHALGTKRITAALKGFFNGDGTADESRTRLCNQATQTDNGISDGKEVIEEFYKEN